MTISYRPSLAGRLSRRVLPALQRVLPWGIYTRVYQGLYGSYKRALRGSYWLHVARAQVSGDALKRRRAQLTRRLLPYTMGGRKALENAFDVVAAAEQAAIPGALVECGVAQGGTAAMMMLANRAVGPAPRKAWLFDSYEGLPEPTPEDYEDGKTGDHIRPLPKGSCLGTVEQVSELVFDTLKLPAAEVKLVKGWFQDTVPVKKTEVGPIAVLRLDGDWYESTRVPLDHLYDQVSPGGFVIIDDYGTCYGSRKAADEFRDERRITSPLNPDGRGGAWFRKP